MSHNCKNKSSTEVKKPISQGKKRFINTENVASQFSKQAPIEQETAIVLNKILSMKGKKSIFKDQFKAYIKVMLQKTLEGEAINYRSRYTLASLMARDLGYKVNVSVITKCSQKAIRLGLEVVQYDHLNSNIVMMNATFYNFPFTWRILQALKELRNTLKDLISSASSKIATLYKNSKKESTPQRELNKFMSSNNCGVSVLSTAQKWKTSEIREEDDHMRWYVDGLKTFSFV